MKLILLTDDNEAVTEQVEELLRKENYIVDKLEWNGILLAVAMQKKQEILEEKALVKQLIGQMNQQFCLEKWNLLKFDEICMDLLTHEVTIQQQLIKLTKTEYAILKLFLQHPLQVLQKEKILENNGNYTLDCIDNSLKVHISNLRKKLKEATGKDYIESVRGIGFMLIHPNAD